MILNSKQMDYLKVTMVQQAFVVYIRWNRWNCITDTERMAIVSLLRTNLLEKYLGNRLLQKKILNGLIGKYNSDFNTHTKLKNKK